MLHVYCKLYSSIVIYSPIHKLDLQFITHWWKLWMEEKNEAKIKFVLFKRTLITMKNNNLQLFHISLSSWDIYTCNIQMRWRITSNGFHSILTTWKIIYIFKIIERNRLKRCMWIQTTNRKTIFTFYGRRGNKFVSRPLNFQNKFICFLFNAKQFRVGTGGADFHWPNQLETEVWSWCKHI